MRENRTYGSVRGGQSNLIPSTRLWWRLRRIFISAFGGLYYGAGGAHSASMEWAL